jgi:hypothetical protein
MRLFSARSRSTVTLSFRFFQAAQIQILYKTAMKDMTNAALAASGPVGEQRPPDIGDQRKIFFLRVLSGICHGSH